MWKNKYQQKHPLLDQWIQFFKINDLTEAEMLKLLEEPIMSKAINALEEISNDPVNKELAEMREKARINIHIMTSEALAKGKAEAIIKMATKGFSDVEIARIFDMTVEEIQKTLKVKI